MNIGIILGTIRDDRKGDRVARWIEQTCIKQGHVCSVIDPLKVPALAVFKRRFCDMDQMNSDVAWVVDALEKTDVLFVITPEYNHSYSAVIKSILDHFKDEMRGKKVGIVTYSGGTFGGILAGEHLSSVCSALGGYVLPQRLAIRSIEQSVDESSVLIDDSYQKRLDALIHGMSIGL